LFLFCFVLFIEKYRKVKQVPIRKFSIFFSSQNPNPNHSFSLTRQLRHAVVVAWKFLVMPTRRSHPVLIAATVSAK